MPFQSEKQRRYLHANHPEIAKRWERDYANGGISNHFRKRFFKGAQADTAQGKAMSPGTSASGGLRHSGNGGGGDRHPPVYTGPTAEEIAAVKAVDEARLQTQEDARRNQIYEDTMSRRDEKIKHKKKFSPVESGAISGVLDTAQTGLGLYNLSNLVKNLTPASFLWSRIAPRLFHKGLEATGVIPKPEKLEEVLGVPDYGTPGSPHEDEHEYDFAAKDRGILDINASEEIISDDGNDIELTAYNAAFDDPKDLSTGVKTLFQAKDGGRIGYQWGGPGGKSPGTSSTGGQRESGRERGIREAATRSRPTSFPTGDASLAEQIAAQDRQRKAELKDIIARGDEEKYDTEKQMLEQKWLSPDLDDPTTHTPRNIAGETSRRTYINNRDKKAYEQALADQKTKFKKMGIGKLFKAALMLLVFKIPPEQIMKNMMITEADFKKVVEHSIPVLKAQIKYTKGLKETKATYEKLGMPEFVSPHMDTELQKVNQTLLDLTQRPDDEDGRDGPEVPQVPQVVSIGGESEQYAQPDFDYWGFIKERQAQKKAYDEKMAQENLMIQQPGLAYGQQFFNSGGLANLFRVKNQ